MVEASGQRSTSHSKAGRRIDHSGGRHRSRASLAGVLLVGVVALGSPVVGSSASATGAGPAIVITSDKQEPGSDGWVRLANGSKQWVDPSCRSELDDRGFDTEVLTWPQISAMPDAPQLPCDEIPGPGTSGGGDDAQSPITIVITSDKQAPGSDGWVEFADGGKQWVSAACRAVLEVDLVPVELLTWGEIAAMADRPQQDCDDLPRPTSTGGSSSSSSTTTSTTTSTSTSTTSTTAPPDVSIVVGSGVNFSSGEYFCVNGWGVLEHDGHISDAQLVQQLDNLNARTLRLPLNEHCWLGYNQFGYIEPHLRGADYRSRIDSLVDSLTTANIQVVLDLHWNAPAGREARGQQPMADADFSAQFWTSVASQYKSNPLVLFDLYNEPHDLGGDLEAQWDCWLEGCWVTNEEVGYSFQSAGMQELVDAVRSTGATQPIILTGLDWGSELEGWLDHLPEDPADNLVASYHAYNRGIGWDRECFDSCWQTEMNDIIAAGYQVVAGEVGQDVGYETCNADYVESFYDWADSRGVAYLGWTYNPAGCGTPPLLQQYSGGDAGDWWGEPRLTAAGESLKAHLTANNQ